MSENMTDSFHPQEKFQANEINNHKREANELFDLINQLNDDNDPFTNSNRKVEDVEKDIFDHELLNINVNTNENGKHALLINHTNTTSNSIASIESLIKPIETISIENNTTSNTNTSSSNSFSEKEKMNFFEENNTCLSNLTNDASNSKRTQQQIKSTKIPRIPSLHKTENTLNSSYSDKIMANLANLKNLPKQQQENTELSSNATSPTNSLTYKLTHELNKLTQNNSNLPRYPRSSSKPAGTNKTSRSMSTNTFDSKEDLSETKYNLDGTRNVKYVVNYKPKESQVKIFNKKLEIKNVTSKIGSLEKAANYVPSGGNVVIESKPVHWNAKSKIGSLERAANYTPSGGNVKIETKKLNWNSQSKIGSLKHADYQPGGGNVKIENHKLDFKEKARPRTNTGLVMIEVNQNSYLSNKSSQSSSSGNISQQISPQSN